MKRITLILALITSLAVTTEAAELFDPPEGLKAELIGMQNGVKCKMGSNV